MNTRSTAVISEEQLSVIFPDNPISNDDFEALFNGAFEQEFSGEVVVQKPTLEGSMTFDTFLAAGIDPTTSIVDEAPPTLRSTLLLRSGEES